jgi:hypothetical protein
MECSQRKVDMISGSYTMSDLVHGQNDRPRIEIGGAFSPGEITKNTQIPECTTPSAILNKAPSEGESREKERWEIEIPNLRRPKSFSGRFNCRARPLLPRAYNFLQQPRSLWMRCGLRREIL